MTDRNVDQDTPASPEPGPAKQHGDALLDQSGSRHGTPPQESAISGDRDPSDRDPADRDAADGTAGDREA